MRDRGTLICAAHVHTVDYCAQYWKTDILLMTLLQDIVLIGLIVTKYGWNL